MAKTDAQLEAAVTKAAAALAAAKKPRIEAAMAALEPTADLASALRALRDEMHDGETKNALTAVVSILTSAPMMIRAELAQVQAAINAAAGE